MNESWIVATPTVVVLVGILMNRQDSTTIRADLGGRIDMLTGKVIGLTDRVSHLKASIGK